MASFTAAFMRCTMASGVAAGASRPFHEFDSIFTPCSASVGMPGAYTERCAVAMPMATSLPDCTWPRNSGQLPNIIDTCPPSRSASAGAWPL